MCVVCHAKRCVGWKKFRDVVDIWCGGGGSGRGGGGGGGGGGGRRRLVVVGCLSFAGVGGGCWSRRSRSTSSYCL